VLRAVLSLVACFVGVLGFPVAALVIDGGEVALGVALAVLSVGAVAVSVWSARRGGGGTDDSDSDEDDGGGGRGGDPGYPGGSGGGPDWAAFDRQRADWEHSTRH
jgi:hypothetical protein